MLLRDGECRLFTHTSQSTARMREMSEVGSPIASRIIARVSTPPAGIPAAPTLDAVAVTLKQKAQMSPNCKIYKTFITKPELQIYQNGF